MAERPLQAANTQWPKSPYDRQTLNGQRAIPTSKPEEYRAPTNGNAIAREPPPTGQHQRNAGPLQPATSNSRRAPSDRQMPEEYTAPTTGNTYHSRRIWISRQLPSTTSNSQRVPSDRQTPEVYRAPTTGNTYHSQPTEKHAASDGVP